MLKQLDFTVAAGVDPKNYGTRQIASSIAETYLGMIKGETSFRESFNALIIFR